MTALLRIYLSLYSVHEGESEGILVKESDCGRVRRSRITTKTTFIVEIWESEKGKQEIK